MSDASEERWVAVCDVADLTPGRGVAALLGDVQVALFLVGTDVFAVGNVDPVTGVAVLSRGLVGSVGDVITVASPLHKQRYDLRTGLCLDDASRVVATHACRVVSGRVEVEVGCGQDGATAADPELTT